MFHDVGQSFLNDPVQRCLDLGRKPLFPELRLQIDSDRRGFREGLDEPLDGGNEPEIIKCLGPQLHRETPDVLKRRHDELAKVGRSSTHVLRPARFLDRTQPEQDRCECLSRLIVQLACEASPLELLPGDDTAESIPCNTSGEVDRDRRAVGELLGQPQICAAEAGIRAYLVVRDEDADRSFPGK